MVMLNAWQRTPLDPGIPSDLPMNGESTDLGASAPDPAGYLGKVNERASLVEKCPWCSAKGQTYSLRSYRINFQESITLCTNPECLFPLVSKPLEEILNSLTPADCKDGGKRRSPCEEDVVACSKRHKAEDPEGATGLVSDVGLGLTEVSQPAVSPDRNGDHTESGACLQGEGSAQQTNPDIDRNPSNSLRDADKMGLENGERIGLLYDRVPAVVKEVRPTAEQVVPLPKEQVFSSTSKELGVRPTEGLGVRPTEELGVRPSEELGVRPSEELGVRPSEELGVRPSEELGVRPSEELGVRPSEELGVRPSEELGVRPTEELGVRPTEELGVRPTEELGVRPTEELGVRPTEELGVRPTEELGVRPLAKPEGNLPEELTERLPEDEEDFPMEEPEARLTEEIKVGPAVLEEARSMIEPEAIPEEQTANLTVERKVGPKMEEIVKSALEPQGGPLLMVAAPSHLFWRNENNLCWLDSLLVALVHCRTLRKRAASLLKNRSPIQRLCNRYSQACDLLKVNEQMGPEDKIARVPSTVLNQVLKELEDLRMSSFKSIQPKLKCNLGQEETPVFALPVLLRLDSHAEALFQHAFHWDFACAACGHTSRSRCQKTLSTFTGVLPTWHPLSAVHQARCNQCLRRLQNRKMVLKSMSPVFALHFVEGLPQNDVDAYSFEFQDDHYFVSTVIQYDQRLKHFATWIREDSDSWLEFDDLKYPQCTSHKCLPVPADQIHMVFWEVQSEKPVGVCPGGRDQNCTPLKKRGTGEADTHQLDLSLTIPQDDTYIMEALTEDSKASPDGLDSSVGSTTLLDAFEGLSHSDIVTLTLVEVKVDADGRTLDDGGPPVAVDSSPVSSTRANGSKGCDTPKQQRGKKGPRTAPRGTPEKAVLPPVSNLPPPTPHRPLPAPDAPSPAIGRPLPAPDPPSPAIGRPLPAPDPPSPAPDPPSPVSKPPAPSAFPATRWSTLLSRHPAFQSNSVIPKRVSPTSSHKPTLKLATDDGAPEKAAEMFSGYQPRAVAAVTNRDDNSRAKDKTFKQPARPQPTANNPPPSSLKPPRLTKGLSQTTLFGPAKNHKAQTSAALSDTSALRLKLLKKLKKKKKLLAALDCVMGEAAPDSLQRPDSTEVGSPYTVSSTTSQCSSSGYDEFFNDLLSPATTSSNLSPDSTGLLEMLVTGQDGAEVAGGNPVVPRMGGGGSEWRAPAAVETALDSTKDDFLEEFMSGTGLQPGHTAENVDFNMFDMFF